MIVFAILIVILIVTYVINQMHRPFNYPPGPTWFPLVGNLLQLKKLSKQLGGQHLAFCQLAELHNTNVLGLKLGNENVVVVSSYSVVKNVLTSDEYSGRPDSFFLKLRCMGKKQGITCTDGELWSVHRQFVVHHLRNLGFGKRTMELMIKEEIVEVLSLLEKRESVVQIGKTILAPAVINILWALTTGSRILRENPLLDRLLELLNVRSKAFDMSGGTLSQHPWLRFVAPERTGYNLIVRLNDALRSFFMTIIDEHHETWTENRNDDLIYSFISEMRRDNGNATFTNDQLVMICIDIFIAGSQTTSNTIDFTFLMMILHPDVQEKVHQSLDKHLSKQNSLDYKDRHKIPYVEAVLLETERYCQVVPISGPRRVLKDTVLEGYRIPKETTVLINVYSIHHDKEYWKDPEVFRPDRFLDDNGMLLSRDRLIPFGLGKRRCLGELLARNCIFMIFAEIMRKYEISLSPGAETPTGVPLPGITLSPENYKAQFTERTIQHI